MSNISSTSFLANLKESFTKKIIENIKSLLFLACGSVVIIYGAYHGYHHFVTLRNKTAYELYLLNKKILNLYPKYKNMVHLKVDKRQQIEDPKGIIFDVVLIENMQKKPALEDNIKKADPFLPPFEEGQFIAEISNTHNLLFNKFILTKYHLLITTKIFEAQTVPLNFHDFYAFIKAMKAIDGFGFFNFGEGSGFSVPHKHLQVLPWKNSTYSIFELIKQRVKEKTLIGGSNEGSFLLKEFKFKHVIRLLDLHNEEDLDKCAEHLLMTHKKSLNDLDNSAQKIPYNMIVTEEWMLIALRSKEKALDSISFNAMGYSGSILVKDEKDFQTMINFKDPMKLLEEISLK